jgi:hypothetical protein
VPVLGFSDIPDDRDVEVLAVIGAATNPVAEGAA